MDAGINNVIYMELYLGPKMANGICGKTIDMGTIDRGSTVLVILVEVSYFSQSLQTYNQSLFLTFFTINLPFSAYIMQLKVLFKLPEIPRVTRLYI
jgi:hypothetical protein